MQELNLARNEASSQKELLSGQTKDNERRIFDLVKDKQEQERMIRENAITIRELVEERDKYKRIVGEKEDEVIDLTKQSSSMLHL